MKSGETRPCEHRGLVAGVVRSCAAGDDCDDTRTWSRTEVLICPGERLAPLAEPSSVAQSIRVTNRS